MAHRRFEFDMPASAEVVFDTFHYHRWRLRWDSLVDDTRVVDGAPCPAPCPYLGAITENAGGGMLKGLSMRTQFVSFDKPKVAAAAMIGASFPFSKWAASMQHRPLDEHHSVMIYTYTFETGPAILRRLMEPVVQIIFDWQTRKRFKRMRNFLASSAHEVMQWQAAARENAPINSSITNATSP